MYCNKCGNPIPKGSNFCKDCGNKITVLPKVREAVSIKPTDELDKEKPKSTPKKKEAKAKNQKLTGWVALLGLGLIITLLYQAYSVVEYWGLLQYTYEIPGYDEVLFFEFIASIAYTVYIGYVLYLYFQKKKSFPKLYIFYWIFSVVFVLLDYFLVASLEVPDQETQTAVKQVLEESVGEIGRVVMFSIIWITYIKKSVQVRNTFVN